MRTQISYQGSLNIKDGNFLLNWISRFLKLDVTRKCPDGLRRRLGSLNKSWPSQIFVFLERIKVYF